MILACALCLPHLNLSSFYNTIMIKRYNGSTNVMSWLCIPTGYSTTMSSSSSGSLSCNSHPSPMSSALLCSCFVLSSNISIVCDLPGASGSSCWSFSTRDDSFCCSWYLLNSLLLYEVMGMGMGMVRYTKTQFKSTICNTYRQSAFIIA